MYSWWQLGTDTFFLASSILRSWHLLLPEPLSLWWTMESAVKLEFGSLSSLRACILVVPWCVSLGQWTRRWWFPVLFLLGYKPVPNSWHQVFLLIMNAWPNLDLVLSRPETFNLVATNSIHKPQWRMFTCECKLQVACWNMTTFNLNSPLYLPFALGIYNRFYCYNYISLLLCLTGWRLAGFLPQDCLSFSHLILPLILSSSQPRFLSVCQLCLSFLCLANHPSALS